MDCKGVVRYLVDYLDGTLDAGTLQELQQHLDGCRDCRIVVDTTRNTIRIICDSEPLPLPAGVRERLDRALTEKLKQTP